MLGRLYDRILYVIADYVDRRMAAKIIASIEDERRRRAEMAVTNGADDAGV